MSAEQPSSPVKAIAFMLDCEPITVYKLADKGVIPKPEKGEKWDIPKCVQHGVRDLRERLKTTGGDSRKSILEDEAEQSKMRTAEMRGELGSRKAIIADLQDALTKGAMAVQKLGKTPGEKKLIEAVMKVLRAIRLPKRESEANEN